MKAVDEQSFHTLAVHAGEDRTEHHGALSVPIYLASIYAFANADQGIAVHNYEQPCYFYGSHDSATGQLKGFGGIIGLDIATARAAKSFLNNVELCTFATSLGVWEPWFRQRH